MDQTPRTRTLTLPDDVWRTLKSRAAMEGKSIGEYLTTLVRFTPVSPTVVTPVEHRTIPGKMPSEVRAPDLEKLRSELNKAITPGPNFGRSRPAPKTKGK